MVELFDALQRDDEPHDERFAGLGSNTAEALMADYPLHSEHLPLVDPRDVTVHHFERLTCDHLKAHRASLEPVVRIDLSQITDEALLNLRETFAQPGIGHGVGNVGH